MISVFAKRFFSRGSILLQESQANVLKSSCKAGTPLQINVLKTGKDPIALEDSEYPPWLWTVLDKGAQAARLENDPLKLRRKELRRKNRANIKQNNFLKQI
ncbi:hypothetical protein TPHA_0O01470 [Tetrapisispora phaffii CBS 4417]|uniref:Large ribosomal subunit protein mL54 n=1 Tax=Tetrapisispora phaffii (strain ATCC 24235 / CBS 4417 / NBRC 1672 / NRRL Y-8282 / UCD 70-5) TaxID=1071381 RepID=G8C1T6_TETPH|nr:mitochondrial 54S ribosomal protein YmL37 TPHA_0O01470 [Tetrapisispora phaffii CBS 4417]CCE66114.1 hypothetical protein TPHA_0O01470 [Tetrapisispora phaffii CBS 4417]